MDRGADGGIHTGKEIVAVAVGDTIVESDEMGATRVLLADDHTLLLGAFEKLLAAECDVVGTVTDGRELVSAAQRLKPEVIVLDIGMPLLNGLEAGRQIKQLLPATKLVFLTMNEDSDLAAEAFRAGASAYLLKRSATSELLTAIREVTRGRSYVTPLVTAGLVGSFMQPQDRKPLYELTPRQREVLQLLAEGYSMKQVADMLNVTPRTVQFHKYRMMQQLGIKSSAELIQFAVRQHIV
jgi:DNA-binding NarL/FixJ family response regulator